MIYIKLNNRTYLQPSHRCPSCIARQRCRNPAEQHRSPCCVHISAAIICQPEVPETKTSKTNTCQYATTSMTKATMTSAIDQYV